MSAHGPITAETSSTASPGWDRPMFERQIAMLGELAEDGLQIVHAILDLRFEFRHGEPAPAWDNPAPKAPAVAVDRIGHGLATGGLSEAKAVRQLDQELDDYERLEDLIDELDDDIPDGPFNEIIAKLCKDLGLAPDWLAQTEARLKGEAAGSPVAELRTPFPLDGGPTARIRADRTAGMGVNAPPSQTQAREAAPPRPPFPARSG